jgi:uncharacterized RDD family membrane protein YckC
MPRYAGFWIRLVAFIVDILVLIALFIVCVITIVGIFVSPFVLLGYMPFCWWKWGATAGQRALGLRVVRDVDGGPIPGVSACIRALVLYVEWFFIGWLIGLVGFIWAAFEPRKRAWHDMAGSTVVIQVN